MATAGRTVINKLKGRIPGVRKMGRDTYFIENEENVLVKYIIASAKKPREYR